MTPSAKPHPIPAAVENSKNWSGSFLGPNSQKTQKIGINIKNVPTKVFLKLGYGRC